MRTRIGVMIFLLIAATVAARAEAETAVPECCVCVVDSAQGQVPLYCVTIESPQDRVETQERCMALNGDLKCRTLMAGFDTCREFFAGSAFPCPDATAAPTLGRVPLAALALLLAVFGGLVVQRRRRPFA